MKQSFFKGILFILAVVFLFPGCATIVSKSAYPVFIHTNPPGVNISITNKKGIVVFKGQSPTTVKLQSGAGYFSRAEYQVRLSSPGFSEKIVQVQYKINAWYFGNLVLGGVLGMLIIDPVSGAMWKIKDPLVDETMVQSTNATSLATSLQIINIQDLSTAMRSKLVRIQ